MRPTRMVVNWGVKSAAGVLLVVVLQLAVREMLQLEVGPLMVEAAGEEQQVEGERPYYSSSAWRGAVMDQRRRSLKATLLPALLKKEGGCNTDPHMCDAKKKQQCCRGRCRNVHSNALHCGGCGLSCPHARSCCAGSCSNLSSDSSNCGRCGNVCMAGLSCHRGLCGYGQ